MAKKKEATKPIGENDIRNAAATLQKYIQGKQNLDERIINNEDWWKLQHWKDYKKNKKERLEQSTSAWMFNSIINKHADAMDNFPEPTVLPREENDEDIAKTLSEVIPVILSNCKFKNTYSKNWTKKLKYGTAIYAVLWNSELNRGMGDIDVKAIDLLSFYWEPGVTDLQSSRNIFLLALEDNDLLIEQYPELDGKLSGDAIDKKEYHYDDTVDTTNKSIVVDWYYKKRTDRGVVVHYVKYVGGTLLFASENDPQYENGWYTDGKYPFVIDVMYTEEGTPAGFGLVDVCRSPQEYIDRLDIAILLNSEEAARRRYLVKDSASINEEEFNDIEKRLIHCAGSPNEDNFRALDVPNLSGTYLAVLQNKVAELKETSANRDFNQGGTTSGVVAASAITALQESGNKTSRDLISESYAVYEEMCNMIIERIRQFYDYPRVFRIIGEKGQREYVSLDNIQLQGREIEIAGEVFEKAAPIFDVEPKAQKANPYSKYAQNELALQFYQLGFFNPQMADQALQCIDMMDFEGKEQIKERIQQGAEQEAKYMQMQQIAVMAAQALAENGDNRVLQALTGGLNDSNEAKQM